MIRLLLLFVVVPLVELTLLLYLSRVTSVGFTVLTCIVTGMIGSYLARSQGTRVLLSIRGQLRQGQVPTAALLDAGMIFVAGALLMTPGILTDLFGFSLLAPLCRRYYRAALGRWFGKRFGPAEASDTPPGTSRIIDAKIVERRD